MGQLYALWVGRTPDVRGLHYLEVEIRPLGAGAAIASAVDRGPDDASEAATLASVVSAVNLSGGDTLMVCGIDAAEHRAHLAELAPEVLRHAVGYTYDPRADLAKAQGCGLAYDAAAVPEDCSIAAALQMRYRAEMWLRRNNQLTPADQLRIVEAEAEALRARIAAAHDALAAVTGSAIG